MRDRELSLALALLLVVSGVAPFAAPAAASPDTPAGFVTVPDQNIQQGTPTSTDFPYRAENLTGGDVLTTSHAATTEVVLSSPEDAESELGPNATVAGAVGDLAIVIRDDSVHEGRTVAIRASEVRDALGYLPSTVEGTHEDGSTWSEPVRTDSGFVVVDIPHFSSNVVTFEGEVSLSSNSATDGAAFSYDLADASGASDPQGTLTGVTATEWDNASASGLGEGDTLAVAPAGHEVRGPAGGDPEVVLTGETQTNIQTESGSVSAPETVSVGVDGNANPSNVELSLTGKQSTVRNSTYTNTIYDPPYDLVIETPPSGRIGEVSMDIYYDGSNEEFALYAISNGQNQTVTSDIISNPQTLSGTVDMEPGETVTLRLTWDSLAEAQINWGEVTSQPPSNVDVTASDGTTASFGDFSDGETKTRSMAIDSGVSSLDFSGSGALDYTFDYTERIITSDPAVDIDGDGIDEISHAGLLNDGETVSYQASSLSVGDDTSTVSTVSGSTVGVDVRLQEVVKTRDPSVEVNGNQVASVSGTLADGTTQNFSSPSSVLKNGTNRVNVSVGDGSLSADAPTPRVGFEYRHDARVDQSVAFEGESWSERYNISRTWADTREKASLTIPFARNVVLNRNLRVVKNGTQIAPTYTEFSNTTLTVGFGDVDPGTETRVVANGSKVRVENGAIQVLEPTTTGNDLDSKVEVISRSADGQLVIGYSGTIGGDRVHYPVNASWSGVDAVHRATVSGDRELRMDAPDGGTFRVQTIPVEVTPQQGDVEVSVSEPRQEEPQFYVEPGDSPSDTVEYTYLNADSDTEYVLFSETDGVVRDSGTANSPITLTDDDSAETLVFQLDDTDPQPPTNNDPKGPFPPVGQFQQQATNGGNLPLVLLVSGIGIAVLWFARSRFSGASGVKGLVGRALRSNVVLGSLVVAVVGVGAAIGGVSLPPGAGLLLLVTGVPLATYLGLRRVGQYSHVAFGAVTATTIIIGLQLLGGDIVGNVLSNMGPAMPILAFGGLYIAYQAIQAYRAGKTTRLTIRGFRSNSNDEGGP